MSEVEYIQTRVRELPDRVLAEFREWFHAFDNERWDAQIAADSRSGRFGEAIARARREMAEGKAREL